MLPPGPLLTLEHAADADAQYVRGVLESGEESFRMRFRRGGRAVRRAAAALLCLLLLCACAAPEQADALPQELAGSWVSAGNGDLIETMTLAQDGTISVQCTFRGKDTGTIRGVWHADGQTLSRTFGEGTSPYQARIYLDR